MKKSDDINSLVITAGDGRTSLVLDYVLLKKSALVLRAVNHPLRKRIVSLLEESPDGRMIVTDLCIKLRIEQAVVSQQLKILRDAGVVITDREGKFIYYSINKQRIQQIIQVVAELNR